MLRFHFNSIRTPLWGKMKIYNLVGFGLLLLYGIGCALTAPLHYGPWIGLAVGEFYLLFSWFLAGVFLSDVIHMGIAHRALDYKDWFIKAVTLLNSFVGVYVDPVSWVDRHRNHHKYSDHEGDPNKLSQDGFWKTMRLCFVPYPNTQNMLDDEILKTWPFKLVSSMYFAVFSLVFSYFVIWFLTQDWKFSLMLWVGTRGIALWVNMIQNYWTHDRRWGYRRYDVPTDNAMNIGDWLPVTATFSACLQNNHHFNSKLLRLSHDPAEYDFGFLTVRAMKSLGLVKATSSGAELPEGLPLTDLGF